MKAGNRPVSIVLGVVGVVAVIVGILYFAVTNLPGFLTAGSHVHGAGHHLLRGAVALVVGLVLLFLAWWVTRRKPSTTV